MELSILFQKDLAAQRNKLIRLHELNSPPILREKQLEMIDNLEAKQDVKTYSQ